MADDLERSVDNCIRCQPWINVSLLTGKLNPRIFSAKIAPLGPRKIKQMEGACLRKRGVGVSGVCGFRIIGERPIDT